MAAQTRVKMFVLLSAVFVFNFWVFAGQNSEDQPQQEERINVWGTREDVLSELFNERKDLVQWAIDLKDSTPATGKEAVIKVDVLMRAGLDDQACKAVDEFYSLKSQIYPHSVFNYTSYLYRAATREYKAYSVALRILERFAPYFLDEPIRLDYYREAKYLPEGTKPWTDDQTIAWLDARIESVRRYDEAMKLKAEARAKAQMAKESSTNASSVEVYYNPSVRRSHKMPIDHWGQLRRRVLADMGRGEQELAQMVSKIRQNPEDAKLMRTYVLAVPSLRRGNGKKLIAEDVKWLGEVEKIKYATDLEAVGQALMRIGQPSAAESFFRSAIEKEVTDAEVKGLAMMCSVFVSMEKLRLHCEIGFLENLSRCLADQDKKDEAQKMMVKAADIRQENNLGMNPLLAGHVQSVTFGREIEGRILEKEKKKENRESPEYWIDRANYYRGRKEADKQEHALRKGLALCKPLPEPRDISQETKRHRVLRDLLRFLNEQKRINEACDLAFEEMKNAPINSESSRTAAYFISREMPKNIDPEKTVIWDWLEKRLVWDGPEGSLLRRTFRTVSKDRLDDYFAYAEELAMSPDSHPSRAKEVGYAIYQMGDKRRSIPILKYAIKTAQNLEKMSNGSGRRGVAGNSNYKYIIEWSYSTLFNSYCDIGNWRNAEKIFDQKAKRLTLKEKYKRFGELAVIAAKYRRSEEAMRIFRRSINCNFRNESLIQEMNRAGLGQEIKMYFEEVQKKLPEAKLTINKM